MKISKNELILNNKLFMVSQQNDKHLLMSCVYNTLKAQSVKIPFCVFE